MTEIDPTKGTAAEADVLGHAWSWFVVHSAQRMQGINYFLVAIALVVAGYGASFAGKNYIVALAIGVLGLGVTYTFWMLDRRTRQLIKASEEPLRFVEAEIARRSGVDSINILDNVEKPDPGHLTYTKALEVLMFLVAVLMLVAIVASIAYIDWPATADIRTTPTPTPSSIQP